MVMRQVDVELPGALPLVLARTHLSGYRVGRSYGPAWATTLDMRIEPDGALLRFADDDGTVLVYPVPTDPAPVLPVEGPRLPLTADDAGWTITRPTGEALRFGPSGLLDAVTDRLGTSRIEIDRSTDGVPVELRHTGGYRVAVETECGLVTSLRLRDGERWVELVRYGYDEGGRLAAVVNSSGIPLRFRSDELDRIVRWDDRNGTWYGYEYDEQGRCVRTTGTDGALSATFDYEPGATTVTDSLGAAKVFEYNDLKQVVRETDALGNVTHSEWDRYDRLLSRTDPLGRITQWTYSPAGNLLRVDRPDRTATVAEYAGPARPVPGGRSGRRGLALRPGRPRPAHRGHRSQRRHDPLPVRRAGAPRRHHRSAAPDPSRPERPGRPAGGVRRRRRHGQPLPARRVRARGGGGGPARRGHPLRVDGRGQAGRADHAGRRHRPLGVRRRGQPGRAHRRARSDDPYRVRRLRPARRADDAGRRPHRTPVRHRVAAGLGVSTFAYDTAGRVAAATTPDAEVRLRRDPLGRVVSEAIDGREVASRYDLLGRRIWRRTPEGVESRWEYGADDRPGALRAGETWWPSTMTRPAGRRGGASARTRCSARPGTRATG
jgi:YD repeat-containing protein